MKSLSSMIDAENYENSEKLYSVNRVYVAKMVRFVCHLPRNIDKRNHVQEIYENNLVLLNHETGNVYTNIETGERVFADTKSAVFYDKEYRPGKLYVSTKYIEKLKGRCYYPLRDKELLDTNYLTAKQLREVLDAELTWEDGSKFGY